MEYKHNKRNVPIAKIHGITVVRIPNNQVNQKFSGVCEYIDDIVKQSLSQRC